MTGIRSNGITISVKQLPKHKRKALCVTFDDEPVTIYKLATFDSNKQANWFEEILKEMFEVKDE